VALVPLAHAIGRALRSAQRRPLQDVLRMESW
jgi:hypothetical protein